MQKKFGILRFISGFYKVVGIIIGVLTLISALAICLTSVLSTSFMNSFSQDLQNSGIPFIVTGAGVAAGVITAFSTVIGGALAALGLYAFGELISLFLAMEENTRATAVLVNKQLNQSASQPVAPPPPQS